MASIQATLVNIHNACNTKEGEAPLYTNPNDYMPIWNKEDREQVKDQSVAKQSIEQIKSTLFSVFGLNKKNYIIKDGKRIRIPKPKK